MDSDDKPTTRTVAINTSFTEESNPIKNIQENQNEFASLQKHHNKLKQKLSKLNQELNEILDKNYSKLKKNIKNQEESSKPSIETEKEILNRKIENINIHLNNAKKELSTLKSQEAKVESIERMAQLEKINKQKEYEIYELNFELSTLKKIHRNHIKTILVNDDEYYLKEINDLKAKKIMMSSKIEELQQMQEKNRNISKKKNDKMEKIKIKLKDFPDTSAIASSLLKKNQKERENFEKLREKALSLKILLFNNEKTQIRNLKNLEKQFESTVKENLELDDIIKAKRDVLNNLREKLKEAQINLEAVQKKQKNTGNTDKKTELEEDNKEKTNENNEKKGKKIKKNIEKRKNEKIIKKNISIHQKNEEKKNENETVHTEEQKPESNSQIKENIAKIPETPNKDEVSDKKETREFSMDKIIKTDTFGKDFPDSASFSDRALLSDYYDLQITKISIYYDKELKIIKGFLAYYLYKTKNELIEGRKNVFLPENANSIETKEFCCEINDYIKSIGGSFSTLGYLESLVFTTNMDNIMKIGEESPHSSRFSLKISNKEIPICLFGEYIKFNSNDEKDSGSVITKFGAEIIEEQIQEWITEGKYHEGKLKIYEGGKLNKIN